jgi:hypothetical protein
MAFGDGRTWLKSQRSGNSGGNCVFVTVDAASVGVRDPKKGPAGPALWVGRGDWAPLTRQRSG